MESVDWRETTNKTVSNLFYIKDSSNSSALHSYWHFVKRNVKEH